MLTHRCHESVGAGALLVLEDDVGVVVWHKIVESLGTTRHPPLGESRRCQSVFADVWHVLFENERREFSGTSPTPGTTAGPATTSDGDRLEEEDSSDGPCEQLY